MQKRYYFPAATVTAFVSIFFATVLNAQHDAVDGTAIGTRSVGLYQVAGTDTGVGGGNPGGVGVGNPGGQFEPAELGMTPIGGPQVSEPLQRTDADEVGLSLIGTASFGCRNVGVREWTFTKDGVSSVEFRETYASSTGSTFPSEGACSLSEYLRWFFHPVGIIVWLPVSACLIFFVLGIARIVFPGSSSGSSSSGTRKNEVRAIIDAYRGTAAEKDIGAAKLSSEWISSIENWIDRLESAELSQVKRAALLQGLSMIVFSLAITICLQGLGIVKAAGSLDGMTVPAVLLVVTPFSILVVASGFLVVQASRVHAERANLRKEQNTAEVLLLQSISKLSRAIDFDRVFQQPRKSEDSTSQNDGEADSSSRAPGTAKDLAVILSHLTKT